MKNKKLISIISFITIAIMIIGIVLFYYGSKSHSNILGTRFAASQDENLVANSGEPDIEVTISKRNYEFVSGDTIEVTPDVKTTGIDTENGDHPDVLKYQWQLVTGGRPSPFEPIKGQTEKTLTINNATINNIGNYCLEVTCERWNEETDKYETLTYDKQRVYGWIGYIYVNVLPEINIDLLSDENSDVKLQKYQGKEEYALTLNDGDNYNLKLELYRYAVKKLSYNSYKLTENKVSVQSGVTVKWSSDNEGIVGVNNDGYLTVHGFSEDPVTITVEVTDINGTTTYSASVMVYSKKVPVTSIEINEKDVTLEVGEHATLTATVEPDNTSEPEVTWKLGDVDSSNIVDINSKTGVVTAKSVGIATVIAEADGKTDTCNVIVKETRVQSIKDELSDRNISLWENADGTTPDKHSLTIHAEVYPTNATNKEITWETSDENVAKVIKNEDGSVTFIAGKYVEEKNTCTITAYADNKNVKQEYYITVLNQPNPITSIAIEPVGTAEEPVELKVGGKCDFNFKVEPENATYEEDLWTVETIEGEPEDVISVDNAGIVTAKKVGKAKVKITVKCYNQEHECPTHSTEAWVSVIPTLAEKVEINLEKVDGVKTKELRNHEKLTLTATVTPDDTTDKTVTWKSLNPELATVDSTTGEVTAIAPGEAKIIATCGSAYDECTIIVTPIKIEDLIMVDDSEIKVKDNEQNHKLEIKFYPEDADNANDILWESSDTTVVEVKQDGTLVPHKAGSATITVKVKNDDEVIPVTYEVIVVPSKTQLTVYTVDQKGKFIPGFTLRLARIDENGEETVVKEISGKGKFDFGELPDGKYTISEVIVPEKDLDNNDIYILESIGFRHFEIEDGEILFLNADEPQYAEDGLVLVNIVDYPEEDEDDLVAYLGNGIDFTVNEKTIAQQYEEFIAAYSNNEQEVPPVKPDDQTQPTEPDNSQNNNDSGLPNTSDIAIEVFAVAMFISLIGITFIIYKKSRKK